MTAVRLATDKIVLGRAGRHSARPGKVCFQVTHSAMLPLGEIAFLPIDQSDRGMHERA
jgi:hypothetical protein